MNPITIALFGEAEKGNFQTAYFCQTLQQLVDYFGNPPPHSSGLYFATQSLLYHHQLIFVRVKEEGFSYPDYFSGLSLLEREEPAKLAAVCLPGVGNKEILQIMTPFCKAHHSILITTEPDLYDYLTAYNNLS